MEINDSQDSVLRGRPYRQTTGLLCRGQLRLFLRPAAEYFKLCRGVPYRDRERHDCRDAGGTSPRMGEGRTTQEQLSRTTPGAVVEESRPSLHDCRDAGGRTTPGAVVEGCDRSCASLRPRSTVHPEHNGGSREEIPGAAKGSFLLHTKRGEAPLLHETPLPTSRLNKAQILYIFIVFMWSRNHVRKASDQASKGSS